MLLTKDEIKFFKENKNEITEELLDLLRKQGNEGKKQALEILDLPKDNDNYYLDAYGNRTSYNGLRTLKSAYTKLKLNSIHIKELEKCKNDIHYFLSNYVRMTTPWGFDFVETRDYQNEFLDVLCSENENIISMQPRQCIAGDTNITINNKKTSIRDLFEVCKEEINGDKPANIQKYKTNLKNTK